MKTVAIIQARMTSRRLPGKVLMDLAGIPMLSHVIRRAEAANVFDQVIVATSMDPTDDLLERYCTSQGKTCFRGSLSDVLERYYQAASVHGADVIVRLTADCPLLDPAVIRKVVQAFDPGIHDYRSNVIRRTYPKGLDTEVLSLSALTRTRNEARLPEEREHVTPYIHKHPEIFRTTHVTQEKDLSKLRWTVDEPQDLAFARAVYAELGDGVFGQEEILALLARRPALSSINAV
jgi:spore coat polysaccharide biosynthesis protein SpsF (cytidylyltransferase family)